MSDGPSRIILPLATTVEPTYANEAPYRESLLKMATVLYDEVMFERGAYSVSIADEAALQHEWADESAVDFERILSSPGPFVRLDVELRVAPGDTLGDGSPIDVILDGRPSTKPTVLQRQFDMCVEYASEIEHSLAAKLAEFNTGWLIAVDPVARPVNEFSLLFFNRPGERLWEQYADATVKGMEALARRHGAALAVGPMHRPDLREPGPHQRYARAFACVVPDVSALPWETVIQFRDHPAARQAREQLWEMGQAHGAGDRGDLALAIEKRLRRAERETLGVAQRKQTGARVLLSGVPDLPIPFVSGMATEAVNRLISRRVLRQSWADAVQRLEDTG
jgi:hypothetical protein